MAALTGLTGGTTADWSNLLTTQDLTRQEQSQGTGTQDTTRTIGQQNLYTPGQQALQAAMPGYLQNFMTGNYNAERVGLPRNVWDTAIYEHQKNVEPQLAAIHGSGSPVQQSSMDELLMKLAAMGSQQASANYLGGLGAMQNYAFNAVGQNQQEAANQATAQQATSNLQQHQTSTDIGGLAGVVNNFLAGTFRFP
jgi:hypothetical protein